MTAIEASRHWDHMYENAVRSAWTQNPLVATELYRRMTGEPGFWMEWTFTKGLPPIQRMLSIGCGDGGHELAAARRGFAQDIVAFDASPIAIESASHIARSEGLPVQFEVGLFEDFVASPPEASSFDAVLFSGSLHHVTDLEGMLSTVRHVLRPGGKVIVNEYVGPIYQLYPQSQVSIVNKILDHIPPSFRVGPDDYLILPSIEGIMANDPTEGVRAPLIRPLLSLYFNSIYHRDIGGSLLHPIFSHLNATKVNDGSAESHALVSMLIATENALTESGTLSHDFMFAIYERQ